MSNNSSPAQQRISPQGTPNSQGSDTDREKIQSTAHNLPPSRTSASLRTVSAPLSKLSLSRLIYILAGLTVLLLAFYSYRVVQYKREVGGWWSLAMGKTPAEVHAHAQEGYANPNADKKGTGGANEDTVGDRIGALAEILGMPSNELASAIASAVRAYVPPASLSSVAAKETGEAVKALLGQEKDEEHTQADGSPGVVGGILHGVESFAGMDEPNT
ncbi:hypothetical protein BDN70DRAFT_222275 [Pholiota conissans]|uniref:Uncharacterized protein n=1 Tax=Pholiota conissans TaxID=109636 RepID=A0A9P6CWZ9_9AGAR|nr:hypothetical protein BDN70DRAFT_222275 [Pholiota conissans]